MFKFKNLALGAMCSLLIGCTGEDDDQRVIPLEASRTEDLTVLSGEVLEVSENSFFMNDASLRMKPGSRLRFTADVQLQIQGSLLIDAASGSAVHIEGSSSSPRGSMRVSGDSLLLSNVVLSGLSDGLIADVDSVFARDIDIIDCGIGLYLSRSNGVVDGVDIHRNTTGLWLELGQWEVRALHASDNGTGLYLSSNTGTVTQSSFEDNIHAINSENSDQILLTGNTFDRNETAVRYYYGRPWLDSNQFEENTIDVLLSAYPRHDVHVKHNNFMSSVDYTLYILPREWHNPHTIDVSENFWNTSDVQTIENRIYDGFDHSPCDTLIYQPVSSSMHSID